MKNRLAFGLVSLLVAALAGCSTAAPTTGPTTPAVNTTEPLATPSVLATAPGTPSPSASTGVGRYIALEPVAMEQRYAAGIGWFDYRESEPLDITVERSTEVDGIETKSITYASSTGRSVPAALVAPAEHAGLPGIIWLCPCGPVVDRAQEFAPLGSIVITIDAPQMRPDGFALTYSEQDKDELIELIIELRRAVDVLIESGADPNRIAFIGYSWGAAMGGVLAGVEPRIGAYAFMFGDGGLVEHALETPDAGFTAALSDAALDAWLRTMEPLESLYFIPFASRSRLLFQNGRYDDIVAEVSARRFHEYASDPKDIRWYDSGHDPTPDAPEVWCDLAKWLKAGLELSSSDIAECG